MLNKKKSGFHVVMIHLFFSVGHLKGENSISLYICTTYSISIHLSMDIQIISMSWLLYIMVHKGLASFLSGSHLLYTNFLMDKVILFQKLSTAILLSYMLYVLAIAFFCLFSGLVSLYLVCFHQVPRSTQVNSYLQNIYLLCSYAE